MIRQAAAAVAGVALATPAVALRQVADRGARRLLAGPRTAPGEDELRRDVDALGGTGIRLRARDGVGLAARWLPAESPADDGWQASTEEAVLLLHGYTGSIVPNLVEYAPFLRRTAGVLGLDFRGHGGSDDAATTFGLREVDDVGGALAWLGDHGVRRVALFGTSMGGIVAIASVAVLGDGTLSAADSDPDALAGMAPPPRPRIVAVVGDSVPAELPTVVANRLIGGPLRGLLARAIFRRAAVLAGGDLRATEPGRVVGLLEPVPLLLIHGDADPTLPIREARDLAARAGPSSEQWVVPGADHSGAHRTAAGEYERRVTTFLRDAFGAARDAAILAATRTAQ